MRTTSCSISSATRGVGRSGRGDLLQALMTKRVGERREPAAAKLGFEATMFLAEVGDDLLRVTLDPPGAHGEQP